MEHTSNTQKILSWGAFIVIIILIIWGLIAAEKKSQAASASLVLPTEIVESDHSRGSTIASTTLVEYGDFQCPACGEYYPLVEQAVKDLGPDNIRMVFRNFPLPQHQNAIPAAKAAEAAGLQGKYWEMYNMLYERQTAWENTTDPRTVFTGYAKEMGLDLTQFATDYDSKAVSDKINNDALGGEHAGINQTPTFFLNGKEVTDLPNPNDTYGLEKLIQGTTTAISI